MSNLIWRSIAAALLLALVVVGGSTGAGWWLAARDRDAAIVERDRQKAISDQFQVAIREQNRATEVLAEQKTTAETRGHAAQKLAAAHGRRFDDALKRISGVQATTCDEAMPTVDAVLEAIR